MIWKTFAGRCIYHSPTGVRVWQNYSYRWLTFDSLALQTVINRKKPTRPALEYIHALTLGARISPGASCLLGLGGAGVVHALSPFFIHNTLTAVEKSSDVIDIANTYFMTESLPNLRIIHDDALSFVKKNSGQYQHLMIDLFNNDTFPRDCCNLEFFTYCQRILLPNGILAINLANTEERCPVFDLIRQVFKRSTLVIPIKHTANMVILAHNSASITPLLKVLTKNVTFKQLTWDPVWGCCARF
jgi:spermidine synthase